MSSVGGSGVEKPEVRVRSTRRRESEASIYSPPTTPHVRNWLIYAGLSTLVGALMLDGFLSHRPSGPILPPLSHATEVQSAITQQGDSLIVVVSWDLTLADSAGWPDSIRVTVVANQPQETLLTMQSAKLFTDTLTLAGPAPGQTIDGFSCAAATHPDEMQEDVCAPWQYVRPSEASEAAGGGENRDLGQPPLLRGAL
jgi:hypothetical protein